MTFLMHRPRRTRARVLVLALLLLALLAPAGPALAHDGGGHRYDTTGAEFWQWALAQPAATNPLTDTTGEFCDEGQRGRTWFLAGSLVGPVTRECTIPYGKKVVFPVVNFGAFAFPDDPPEQRTEEYLRAQVAGFKDAATGLRVTVDGTVLRRSELRYEESRLFSVPMPADNLFAALGVPGLPDGPFLLGPCVDAGYYVTLRSLRPGAHTLHIEGVIEAADPAQNTVVDVTYELTVQRTRGPGQHGG
ncbi:hypothetical protein [Cellulomonas sp.]|uniref:hypothetical protein n=1 Tax=Cellulomonas sp. TaxID=40001 RepID=UPI003BA9FA25